jgi:hypothetical protein
MAYQYQPGCKSQKTLPTMTIRTVACEHGRLRQSFVRGCSSPKGQGAEERGGWQDLAGRPLSPV